jgi:hypothetical protein
MGFQPGGVGVKVEKESKLGPLAGIIGALAGILIIIVAAHASFPIYLYYGAVISLLVAIFSLLIFGFLAHPLYNFIKKRSEIRKHNALARKYFDEFAHFTDRFSEFLDQTKKDNIPDALKKLWNNEAFRCVSFLSTADFYNLFKCYKERLKRFGRTKEDFALLVNEFGTILNMYNEFCVCKPVKEIRAIGREKVDEDTKDNYKNQKGGYELFLRNYTDFGKKLKKEFGERIFRDYFEMPEEL